MLLGDSMANPHPDLRSVSERDGPGGPKPRGGAAGGPPRPPRPPPNPKPPNIIRTGTRPSALFGVVTVIEIFTSIVGDAELSTLPTSCFSTAAISPMVVS